MKNIIASMIVHCFAATNFANLKSGIYEIEGGCNMSVFSFGNEITFIVTFKKFASIRRDWTRA